jgi:hypothetical protein
MEVDFQSFLSMVKQSPVPGRDLTRRVEVTFVLRLEMSSMVSLEDVSVGIDKELLVQAMQKVNFPLLTNALRTCESDKIYLRGGCERMRVSRATLPMQAGDFFREIERFLSENNGEKIRQLLEVLQEMRRKEFVKQSNGNELLKKPKRGKMLPDFSAIASLASEKISWRPEVLKQKKNSQSLAAPVSRPVFVTFYRYQESGSYKNAIVEARLLSKRLKMLSVEFLENQCHRFLCLSKDYPWDDLTNIIRQAGSKISPTNPRSVEEQKWVDEMQILLLESIQAYDDSVCKTQEGLHSKVEDRPIWALFTWDHRFHLMCEQAICSSNLPLEELEYTFFTPIRN